MYLFDLYCRIEFWILRKIGLKKFGSIGKNTLIKYGFYGDSNSIEIGDYVYVGENCHFWGYGGISIGNGSIFASGVIIRSSNHDYKTGDYIPYGPGIEKRKVTIGENCWVGANVLIAPGTQVGEGSIIGFGAVLSGKYSPYSIIVGNPGKIIKTRDIKTYKKLKENEKIYLKYFR